MNSYLSLTLLLCPFLVIYTGKLAWRYRCLRYFRQRLGFNYADIRPNGIWIHCASVGEVNTFRPLLRLLQERYPAQHFIITSNTVTGAGMVKKFTGDQCQHVYLPVDTYGAVTRFLNHLRPRLALVMETELWPLLYQQCRRRQIPISIINGRLSSRTLHSNAWIKARYHDALQCVDHLMCRSEIDQQAYVELGMPVDKTEVTGNLKFAQSFASAPRPIDELMHRHYLLAASTHDDEELQLARVWNGMDTGDRLLVIAPRHPERGPSILEQLAPLKLSIALRSRHDPVTSQTDVYIADTLGELASFMQQAQLVFIGGSLIPRGGQNLLEPAALGKAIVVGPHMQNFAAETELLLSKEACVQLASVEDLKHTLENLLADAERRQQLGENAHALIQQHAGIAETYLHALITYYDAQLAS